MHDANGSLLKVGDKVLIPAVITEFDGGEEFCNARLQSTMGRRPDGHVELFDWINTGVVVKAAGSGVSLDL
jgi:hypothetical protein